MVASMVFFSLSSACLRWIAMEACFINVSIVCLFLSSPVSSFKKITAFPNNLSSLVKPTPYIFFIFNSFSRELQTAFGTVFKNTPYNPSLFKCNLPSERTDRISSFASNVIPTGCLPKMPTIFSDNFPNPRTVRLVKIFVFSSIELTTIIEFFPVKSLSFSPIKV